jgi:hypothetical protein
MKSTKQHTVHLLKKVSSKIVKEPNMFQDLTDEDLGAMETKVIIMKCECGFSQEFHLSPDEPDYLPQEMEMKANV